MDEVKGGAERGGGEREEEGGRGECKEKSGRKQRLDKRGVDEKEGE